MKRTNYHPGEIPFVERLRPQYRALLWLLVILVALGTAYLLILPALTQTPTAYCGLAAHTHDETCYDETGAQICALQEHTHTANCYSDPEADVETEEDWGSAALERTEDLRQSIVAVAQSQLGYRESTRNYYADEDGVRHGYTRYGAWAGSPYCDWNGAFAAFCLHYAGLDARWAELSDLNAAQWAERLTRQPGYAADAIAQPGDVLVLDRDLDGQADRSALVIEVNGSVLTLISGDDADMVTDAFVQRSAPEVLGVLCTVPAPEEGEAPPPEADEILELPEESSDLTAPAELPAPAWAGIAEAGADAPQALPQNDSGVTVSGSCGPNAFYTLYGDGELVITGTGAVTSAPWLSDHADAVRTLAMESGVTSLCNNAFKDCTALESAQVSAGLSALSAGCFQGCTTLREVTFPEDSVMTSVANAAFQNCPALESITLPDTVATLGNSVFTNCTALESVHFPQALTTIGSYCFQGCTALQDADLSGHDKLKSIAYQAFASCTGLTELDLSGCTALTTIGSQAFTSCSSLRTIRFDGCTALKTLDNQAFQYCSSLEALDFSGCTALTTTGYDLFRVATSLRSVSFAGCTQLTGLTQGMFSSCTALERVDLSGTGITSIGSGVFQNCRSLTDVDLSGSTGLTLIDSNAFSGCSGLTRMDLSGLSNLKTIGSSAFSNCTGLAEVNLEGCTGLTTIGTSAFNNCKALAYIDLSAARDTLTALNNSAFSGSGLVEIDLHDFTKLTTVGIGCFNGCQKLETALFRGCTALQNLGGNSYTNSRQFYNTPVLKLVDLRDCTALEAIGSECFSTTRNTCTFLLDGCTALRYIYSNAFAGHGAAVPLDLSSLSALELIDSDAFVRGRYTGTLVIPENVVSIGSSAFGNSSSYGTYNQFTVLDLSGSESLETIGSYAFAYLPLQTVDFSGCGALRTIDANAFRNDLALVSANLSDCVNLETIGGNAFQDCTALTEVVIPASVTSVSESAFKNDSAVSRLTWNAKDYPTALGPQTFTSSNGFASGYELHIGQDTDRLPENFFEAVHSCGDIFFDGENELLVLPASATVGAPVPISGIDGTCYVDAYGVVYQLSEDGGAASVAYCPPGLTEYTVPAHISVGGQEIPVTGVHPSAFILARDLAHVRFEDASAITEMGQSAFYGVAALTQVSDEASGQTVSTVSGAVGLFPNATVAASVFRNTGLEEDMTDRPWTPGTAAAQLEYDDGELRMNISIPAQNSASNAGWVWEGDGSYRYLTGAFYSAVFSAANDTNHPTTGRIYFDFSNVNHVGMDSSLLIEGSNIAVTLRDTSDPDIRFYEFTLEEGETLSFTLFTTFPSPDTPGGELHIWTAAVEDSSVPADPVNLSPTDSYIAARWVTRRQERQVTKAQVGSSVNAVGDGAGGPIADINASSWNIGIPNVGQTADPNYGKDCCTQAEFSDILTLPEAVHWSQPIRDALAAGRYAVRNEVSGSNRVGTLSVTDETGTVLPVLTLRVPTTVTLTEMHIEPIEEEDGSVERFRLFWTVRAKNENTELAAATASLQVPKGSLQLYLNEIQENYEEISFPLSMTIRNDVDAVFHYTYTEALLSEAHAQQTLIAPAANLTFTKTRASGSSATYTNYMGLGDTFTLTVSNLNTGSTTGLKTVSDPLNQFLYLKAADMERMFADDYGDRLSITISNAALYAFAPVTGTGIDGLTPVTIDAENSARTAPVATGQTVTIRAVDGGYAVGVGDETATYPGVQAGLDAIGYVVTGGDACTVTWTFTDEEETFVVYGGKVITLPIYITHKSSFGNLIQDWHHHFDCENDWMATLSNTAHMAYDSATKSASCASYRLRYDFSIGKAIARNGVWLDEPNKERFSDGDELTYTLSIRNRGGAVEDLPLVDDMSGAQVLLVPAAANAGVDWGATGTPSLYTAQDGSTWYVLDRAGTWQGVTVGVDKNGNACVAESVSVTPTTDSFGEIAAYATAIRWYYPAFPGGTKANSSAAATEFSTDTLTYRALVRTNGRIQYTFQNKGWLNDRPEDRLYASVGGGGSILLFDKQIVTANPNLDGHTDGETLAPNDYSALTEKNHVVTYKISLQSVGDGVITLSGADLFDRLPQTFGIFPWTAEDISLSYRTDDPEHVSFTGMDDWYLTTASPIPALWEDDAEGQYYIRWPETSTIAFTAPARAYLYVTLCYTDNWDAYCAATRGNAVENTVYVHDFPENVVHDIVGQGSVVLQKGVNLIRKAGLSKTRSFYDNAYSHLEYYVVLFNGGNNRLYLTDMTDTLPRGFTFYQVNAASDSFPSSESSRRSTVTYSDEDLEKGSVLPIVFQDSNFQVRFRSVAVQANDDDRQLRFHFTGKADDPKYVSYDETYDACYLKPGEAIVFCYTVLIDPGYENTDDAALNRISMRYLDPMSTGVTVYEDATITGRSFPDIDYNDGNCFLTVPDMNVEQLNSEVLVRRGDILPGVDKRLISFTEGATTYPVYSVEDAVSPMADLTWEIDTYNEGSSAINGYTIEDVMQYPYRFGGDVDYRIYDLDGSSLSGAVYDSSGTLREPLFTITGHTETAVTVLDRAGKSHTVAVGGDPVTLDLPYISMRYNGVSRTAYTAEPYNGGTVLTGSVAVSFFIDPETRNETMRLSFPEGVLIHFPGCVGKLTVTTKKANVNVNNTTYVNTAFFSPADANYSAYLVDKGTPILDESGDNVGVESYGFVTVRSGWATSSLKTVSEDARPENTASSMDAENVITLLSQDSPFTYALIVQNTNQLLAMDSLLILDNLPQPGDVYPLQPEIDRYSDYTVDFAEDLDLTVELTDAEGGTATLDPTRYTVEFNERTVFDEADWNGGGAGWTAERTESSRSLRVRIEDSGDEPIMPPGGTVTVRFRAQCGEGAAPGLVANNGFAYRYTMNQVTLEASPLLVRVRVPDYPYLIKRTTDRYGRAWNVEEDTRFSFVAYRGDALAESGQALIEALETQGIPYHIYSVTVPAGTGRSERVKLWPDADLSGWQWIQGQTYSIRELPYGWEDESLSPRDYAFQGWLTDPDETLTFVFDGDKTQIFTAENRHMLWDLDLVKIDSMDADKRLPGAVFALYSPNAIDALTAEEAAALDQEPVPLTWTDGLGATWYLADVCITDETGGCLLADLPEQTYVLVERSAPEGYDLLPAPVYVSSYDLDGAELTLHRAVPNTYGYELPQTGGVSTLPFYLCGAALFGLAIRLLILALRRARHVRT